MRDGAAVGAVSRRGNVIGKQKVKERMCWCVRAGDLEGSRRGPGHFSTIASISHITRTWK